MCGCDVIESMNVYSQLRQRSVHSGLYAVLGQFGGMAINLASAVVLARMLSPRDFGVVAMASAVIGFVGLFRELGLSTAAIQNCELTHDQKSTIFWVNVITGIAIAVCTAFCSPLAAKFYRDGDVGDVVLVLSCLLVITSVSAQSNASLVREMQFGRQSIATLSGALVSLIVAVYLASRGFRYWSLVWAQVVGGVTCAAMLIWLAGFWPKLPSFRGKISGMMRFGAHVTAFDLVNYIHRNLDNVLIGRFCGGVGLGLYSRAYSLLMVPVANLRGPISNVSFPALSRLRSSPDDFRNYYRKIVFLVALVTMPLVSYLFVNADVVIGLVLGRDWTGAVPIFSWLAVAAFLQPVAGVAGTVLLSLGDGRRYLECGVFNTLVFCVAFLTGLHWGPVGVAAAYAVANIIVVIPWLYWAFRHTPIGLRDFFWSIVHPAGIAIVSGFACLAFRSGCGARNPFTILVAGAGIYTALALVGFGVSKSGRAHIIFLWSLMRELVIKFSRKRSIESSP